MSTPGDAPAPPQAPIFVERQAYRRRRIVDAARAMPWLGLLLWSVPLLWSLPETPRGVAGALVYIFGVWTFLVAGSALLILAMKRRDTALTPEQDAP